MPLEPTESGITEEHARCIAGICRKHDIFLFVRPSEAETMLLIDNGFGTKSMDVHDKSSNWGPMAGTVPLDRGFSKKFAQHDVPQTVESMEDMSKKVRQNCDKSCRPLHKDCHFAKHGVETPVQLVITNTVLNMWKRSGKVVPVTEPGDTTSQRVYTGQAFDKRGSKVFGKIVAKTQFVLKPVAVTPEMLGKWGLENTADNRVFWRVFWKFDGGAEQPLFVWAYPVVSVVDDPAPTWNEEWAHTLAGKEYKWKWKKFRPVTGDYDLWMVAPHLAWWKLHMHIIKFVDEHHVASAATFFNNWLNTTLNGACNRADNPVFNHGAEEQNYGFTQPLDKRLAMFTSSGDARMVSIDDMPQIMVELMHAGYLCFWNKRYDGVAPALSGKAKSKVVTAYETARTALGQLLQEDDDLKASEALSVRERSRLWEMSTLVEKAREKLKKAKAELTEMETELYRFSAFYRKLAESMERADHAPGVHPGFTKLSRSNILERDKVVGAGGKEHIPDAVLAAQDFLQRSVVHATTGGGESDLDLLEDGYDTARMLEVFQLLSEKVKPAPGLPQTIKSGDFIPRSAGKDTYNIQL